MPTIWVRNGEDERCAACACRSCLDILGIWLVNRHFKGAARIYTTVYSNVDCCCLALLWRDSDLRTFPIHVCRQIKLCNVFGRYRLKPDCLPDATTWCVPDHTAAVQGLLADWNLCAIGVCGVVNVDYATRIISLSQKSANTVLTAHWCRSR